MKRALLAATILLGAPATVLMAEPQSAYTDLKLADCRTIETFEEGTGVRLSCPGHAGIDVVVVEGDLRFYVGYGKDADQSCALKQTFGPFNSLGPKIEWRFDGGKPYATILRWYLDQEGGGRASWLVVTRLDGASSCHVAYIEGAMPDANSRARAAADIAAPDFRCASDPVVIVARPETDTSGLYPRECAKP